MTDRPIELPDHTGPALSVAQAAGKVGMSAATIRKWLKEEKALKSAVARRGDQTLFPQAALRVLGQIQARRFKAASPALKAAWAARRAGTGKGRTARAKAKPARAARPTTRATGWGITGAEAALALGINKVRLYDLMNRHGIKKSSERRSFTPDVLAQLQQFVGASRTVARRAHAPVPRVAANVTAAGDRALEEALAVIQRVASDFRDTVTKLFEQQRDLLERTTKPLRVKIKD